MGLFKRKKFYRKYERRSILVLLNVTSAEFPDKTARAAVINISMGGAAFESTAQFRVGEVVMLRFTSLPGNKVHAVYGEVRRLSRRTGTYVYGVKFEPMGISSRIRLKKTIWDISRSGM